MYTPAGKRKDNTKRCATCRREDLLLNGKLSHYKYYAKVRGFSWDKDMTKETCSSMMKSPCHYCTARVPLNGLHGIDRVDNRKGYSVTNCVGCCKECNISKGCVDAQTFVDRCVHIASCNTDRASLHPEAWPDTKPTSFSGYRRNSKFGSRFTLSKEEYKRLIELPCHYCRRDITETNKSGIDRVDCTRGYTMDNVVSCCCECNRMKHTSTQKDFLDRCTQIADRAESFTFPEMEICLRTITKNKNPAILMDPSGYKILYWNVKRV
jgi:hypothetical protein